LLEEKIKIYSQLFDKIWYAIDGVYSMYGDLAPIEEIKVLLDKYPRFHLYVDDAHGMSIAGKNGTGTVLDRIDFHNKMVLATSLNKAFGVGAAVFVFPFEEMVRRVKSLAGTYIFSGSPQIPILAGCIASAQIHLSDEIYVLQERLKEKTKYCSELITYYDLPNLSNDETPIFFIGVGLVATATELVFQLKQDGFFVNLAIAPAVSDQSAGIRFTITLHHTKADIKSLVEGIAYHMPRVFQALGRSTKDIHRGFKNVKKFDVLPKGIPTKISAIQDFEIQYETSIENIPKEIWDNTIGQLGANNWEQMIFFEKVFSANEQIENNWKFHYYIIRDKFKQVCLVTYFTETIVKDDMFSSSEISKDYEEIRKRLKDDYYMTSKALTMGCLLSVGKHIYLDYSNDWKKAFSSLLEVIQQYREENNIPVLSLRDFDSEDNNIKEFMIDHGLLRIQIPNGHILNTDDWNNQETFLNQLKGSSSDSKSNKRRYIKKRVFAFESEYHINIINESEPIHLQKYMQLYKNVSRNNFEINGFELPITFFENITKKNDWEVIELRLNGDITQELIGIAVCYKSNNYYHFLVTGMNYDFVKKLNLYPQILWQVAKRGKELGLPIDMGITASQNKRKMGAEVLNLNSIYVQNEDNFKNLVLSTNTKSKVLI